jgi:cytosine/creatinine deaminase
MLPCLFAVDPACGRCGAGDRCCGPRGRGRYRDARNQSLPARYGPGAHPPPAGSGPLQELHAAGVELVLATDNVRDPFYPYGVYDPLEALRLGVIAGHLDPAIWAAAITTTPAQALGLDPPKIVEGQPANFMLIEGRDWAGAISNPRTRRHIFRAGRAASFGAAA